MLVSNLLHVRVRHEVGGLVTPVLQGSAVRGSQRRVSCQVNVLHKKAACQESVKHQHQCYACTSYVVRCPSCTMHSHVRHTHARQHRRSRGQTDRTLASINTMQPRQSAECIGTTQRTRLHALHNSACTMVCTVAEPSNNRDEWYNALSCMSYMCQGVQKSSSRMSQTISTTQTQCKHTTTECISATQVYSANCVRHTSNI